MSPMLPLKKQMMWSSYVIVKEIKSSVELCSPLQK